MTSDEREIGRLSGEISQHIFEEFCALYWPFRFGGDEYDLLSDEDAVLAELGYSGEPGEPLVLRRKSDGKCFEVDLEAWVRPVATKAEQQEMAGQLALPGGTS